mmetsp:Transcript_3196/g.8149  ORF Transcript_3196/g.8149 Transcript_3196/m.8149 type:complete len:257 (-) Transcript_3196:926-1696(-)
MYPLLPRMASPATPSLPVLLSVSKVWDWWLLCCCCCCCCLLSFRPSRLSVFCLPINRLIRRRFSPAEASSMAPGAARPADGDLKVERPGGWLWMSADPSQLDPERDERDTAASNDCALLCLSDTKEAACPAWGVLQLPRGKCALDPDEGVVEATEDIRLNDSAEVTREKLPTGEWGGELQWELAAEKRNDDEEALGRRSSWGLHRSCCPERRRSTNSRYSSVWTWQLKLRRARNLNSRSFISALVISPISPQCLLA